MIILLTGTRHMHNGGWEDGAGAPLIVTVWTKGVFSLQMFFNDDTWSYLWVHFQLICEFMRSRKVLMVRRLFIAAHLNPANIPLKKKNSQMDYCGGCVMWYKAALV